MKQWVWILALALTASVAAGAQLDRQARFMGAVAGIVPEPFRAFAQEQLTERALEKEDPILALAEARTLLERRPVPAEHVRLFAQAQALSGQGEAGLTTIQIAAQRGWRDPIAQEARLRLALSSGAEGEAAVRYAALFASSNVLDETLEELGPQVLSTPAAIDQFAAILSGSERWRDKFLQRGSRLLPFPLFARITVAALERETQFDCRALQQVERQFTRRDPATAQVIVNDIARRC
ncbi:MAG: hypothetical protein AAGK02_17090 [Pseudomonadota bacterium]